MTIDRVEGLRSALSASPANHVVRLMLAEALMESGKPDEALAEYELLRTEQQLDEDGFVAGGRAALAAGRHDRAQTFVDAASSTGAVNGISELKQELNESLGLQQLVRVVKRASTRTGSLRSRGSSWTRNRRLPSPMSAASTT